VYANEHDEDDLLHLRIEAKLQRTGLEIRLVVATDAADERPARRDESLIKAVARGYAWYERLVSGEVDSLRAIAKELRVNERYVSRIFRCAFLAPDIVEPSSKAVSPRSSPSRSFVSARRFSGQSSASLWASAHPSCNASHSPRRHAVKTGPAKRRLEKFRLGTPVEHHLCTGEWGLRSQLRAKETENSRHSLQRGGWM
jgi:hypothetical protein